MANELSKISVTSLDTIFNGKPVNQSELTKYVDISAQIPCGKGRVKNENNFTTIHNGDYINNEGEKSFSTSYIDISFTDGKSKCELFGLNSVDISFDASLYPIVTMNFTDVRGAGLINELETISNNITQELENDDTKTDRAKSAIISKQIQQNASSFFKLLLDYPYPIFTLTIKGYYGPTTKFDLQVSDFKTSFDSTTGDFIVTVTFIGYMYGCLADIPMSYVLMAPYLDGENGNVSTLWSTNNYYFDDDNSKIPTVIDFLRRLDDLYNQNKKEDEEGSNSESKKYIKLNGEISQLKKLESALKEHDDNIKNSVLTYRNDNSNSIGLVIDRTAQNGDTKKNGSNNILNSEIFLTVFKNLDVEYETSVEFIENSLREINTEDNEIYNIEKEVEDIVKNNKKEYIFGNPTISNTNEIFLTEKAPSIVTKRFLTKESTTGETKYTYSNNYVLGKHDGDYANNNIVFARKLFKLLLWQEEALLPENNVIYNIQLFDKARYELNILINKKTEELRNSVNRVKEEIKDICKKYLGFMPTSKNVLKMLFAHLHVLYKSIINCANKYDDNKRIHDTMFENNEYLMFDYDCDRQNVNSGSEAIKTPSFPFVAMKKGGNNTSVVSGYEPIYPNAKSGINGAFTDSYEVRYVDKVFNNLTQMGDIVGETFKSLNSEIEDATKGEYGDIEPSLPIDFFIEKNPYENVKDNGNKIAAMLALRMRTNKICGTIDDKTFLERELNNIYNTTRETNTLNTLAKIDIFKVMRENYGGVEGTNEKGKKFFTLTNEYDKPKYSGLTETILWADNWSEIKTLKNREYDWKSEDDHAKIINDLNGRWFQIDDNDKKNIQPFYYSNNVDKFNKYKDELKFVDIGDFEKSFDKIYYDKKGLIDNIFSVSTYSYDYDGNEDVVECKLSLFDMIFDGNNDSEEKKLFLGSLYLSYFFRKTVNFKENIVPNLILSDNVDGYVATTHFTIKNSNIFYTNIFNILLSGSLIWCRELFLNKSFFSLHKYLEDYKDKPANEDVVSTSFYINKEKFVFYGTHNKYLLKLFKEWATTDEDTVVILGKKVYSLRHFYEITENQLKVVKKQSSFENKYGLQQQVIYGLFNRTTDSGGKIIIIDKDSNVYNKNVLYPQNEITIANPMLLKNTISAFFKEKDVSNKSVVNEQERIEREGQEQKRAIYYNIKNMYDRWMCRDNSENLFGLTDDESYYKKLRFYNSHMYDIGDTLILDIDSIRKLVEKSLTLGNSMSVINFISELAEMNKCLFLTLPLNMPNKDNMKKMFEPCRIDTNNCIGNTFIFYLPGENSRNLNNDNSAFTDDGTKSGDEGCIDAFSVKYGIMNQNFFKNISIDANSPIMTEEEIATTLDIANSGKSGVPSTIQPSRSLYPIYQQRSYSCTVDMLGNMAITPFMHFELSHIPMFRGIYKITNVTHRITPQDFTTTFTGTRMSKYATPINDNPIDITFMLDRIGRSGDNENTDVNVYIETEDYELYKNAYNYVKNKTGIGNVLDELNNCDNLRFDDGIKENVLGIYKCKDKVLKILYYLVKICSEYRKEIIVSVISGKRHCLDDSSSQHCVGYAIDVQGHNGNNKNKIYTSKLFIILKAINDALYKKGIDQLIWETHEGQNTHPYPNTIHFSSIEKNWKGISENRGEIFQTFIDKDSKSDTKKVKTSGLFKEYCKFSV